MWRGAAALVLVAALPLHAEPLPVALRSGDHPGFGRLVFDLPAGTSATTAAAAGGVVVHLPGPAGPAPRAPRNVRAITLARDTVTLTLAPGAGWRTLHLPGRLVIDLTDPPTAAAAAAAAATAPRAVLFSGPPQRPDPQPHPPPPPPVAPATPAETQPAPAPVVPVVRAALPVTGPATGPVTLAAGSAAGTLSLPFAAATGAAALRRGAEALVVFDEARPIDLAALHADPAYAAATIQMLPAATVLHLPLAPDAALRLGRDAAGWTLRLGHESLAPIRPGVANGALLLPSPTAGHVVSIPDPDTGGVLLVGTETAPGEAVAVARRMPDATLLATFQGVAVAPISDNVVLRAAPPGFVLEGDGGRRLALDPPDAETLAAADAARLTRRWDFPALPQAALLRRAQALADAAANAPPQARTAGRLAAVQAELALGLGAEAQSLAHLAMIEDGRAAAAADAPALAAIAALLAGRLDDTAALDDPRLDGSDEVSLWRALRRAALHQAPQAAPVLAATLPLLLAYPAPLRTRLLPLAGETLVAGGEHDAAARLFAAHKDDAGLDYARALLDEAEGHAAPALATLDRLAQSPDRRLWARAAVHAAELRLRLGGLKPAEAADALDRLIYAWRGDGRELALRRRVAELRAAAGQWRAALALLRDSADGPAAQAWPDQRAELHSRMRSTFAAALAADAAAPLPAFELVALIGDNPDLLGSDTAGRDIAARLADRLTALDLPGRAAPLLQKLMDASPPGPARAELGTRLAAAALAQNDATGALTALSASAATGLAPDLDERRTLIFARATAARGALAPAVAALAALDTPAAEEAQAGLLEAAKDWPAAEAALARYVQRTLPPSGPLPAPAARTLLRLAAAAAEAGDETMLAQLRSAEVARVQDGKLADMLRLLTERPVQALPDLPRAAQEAALARALPASLTALRP